MTTAAETRDKLLGVDPGSPAGDPEVQPKPDASRQPDQPVGDKPEGPKYVTLEAHQEVLKRLDAAGETISELRSVAGFVKKAQELFAPKRAQPELTERDKLIRSEMLRIMPELADLKDVHQIKETIVQTGAAAQEQIATGAWNVQQDLQKEYQVAVGDADASELIGAGIMSWLNKDQARSRRFYSGDKTVLEEGFKFVVGKLYGPARLERKRQIIRDRDRLPTGGPARGGSPAGGGRETKTLDFRDRKAVRTALAGALSQEPE